MIRGFVAWSFAVLLACGGGGGGTDSGGGGSDSGGTDRQGEDSLDLPRDQGMTDVGQGEQTPVPDATQQDPGGGPDNTVPDTAVQDPGTTTDPGVVTDTATPGVTYQPPDPATTFTYLLKVCDDNPPVEVPANLSRTEEIGGQTWRRLEVGDFEAPTRNGFVSFTRIREGRYEVIGSDVFQEGQPDPFLSWRFDDPIGGPISGDNGLTGTTETTGTLCVMGACDAYDISVTYTLVSTSETIEVAYGTVSDCIHIHFEQRSSDMGDFVLESDWWVKSGIGLIKATEIPGFCGLELKAVHLP